MQISVGSRLKHAWNAFRNRDPTSNIPYDLGTSSSYRPDRVRFNLGNERSIIAAVYTRIAIDVAAIDIKHARLDENGHYLETIDSSLNRCLSLEANLDQSGRAFIQDVCMSLFDEGCIAIVPVDTSINPKISDSFAINSLRTGKIIEWYPEYVKLLVYNEKSGQKEEILMPKKSVAIIENPLYAVMNEPNSTLRRLVSKLNILDAIDKQSGSGKLDLIIQLPYVVRTQTKREQAEQRRLDIEKQLAGSKYGIAYTDGTEHITQLNRPVENNLMSEIEYLTNMLFNQLGLTQAIFDGTADDKILLNYYNRTVEPVVSAIVDAMRRSFLTKTARTQGQSIVYFRDPFKLVPVNELADIADRFTRNEILSSNEVRVIMGYKPADDPRADELRNKNLKASNDQLPQEGVLVRDEVDKPEKRRE